MTKYNQKDYHRKYYQKNKEKFRRASKKWEYEHLQYPSVIRMGEYLHKREEALNKRNYDQLEEIAKRVFGDIY